MRGLGRAADDIEAEAARRPRLAMAILFAWALAVRIILITITSMASGIPAKQLSYFFDGHFYLLIALTGPRFYSDIHPIFPIFRDSRILAAYMPLHPALIWLLRPLAGDWGRAALVAAQLAGAAAAAVFFRLAKDSAIQRPFSAAGLFAVLPPTWLFSGCANLPEGLLALLWLGAFWCWRARRHRAAAALACLAPLANKAGALAIPFFIGLAALRARKEGLKAYWPYLLIPLPLLLFQLYLRCLFGDAFANVHVLQDFFSHKALCWPFQQMLVMLGDGATAHWTWPLHTMIICSAAFYAASLSCAWAIRPRDWETAGWLALFLIPAASLPGMGGSYTFSRYMTTAAPAAWLLLARKGLPRWTIYAVPAAAAVSIVIAGHEILAGGVAPAANYWGPAYLSLLTRVVQAR